MKVARNALKVCTVLVLDFLNRLALVIAASSVKLAKYQQVLRAQYVLKVTGALEAVLLQ